jgi:hypothetical protein
MLCPALCGGISAATLQQRLDLPICLQNLCKTYMSACTTGRSLPSHFFRTGCILIDFVLVFATEFVSIVLCCLQVYTGFPRFKQILLKCGMLDTNCQMLFARKEGKSVVPAALLLALALWFSPQNRCFSA